MLKKILFFIPAIILIPLVFAQIEFTCDPCEPNYCDCTIINCTIGNFQVYNNTTQCEFQTSPPFEPIYNFPFNESNVSWYPLEGDYSIKVLCSDDNVSECISLSATTTTTTQPTSNGGNNGGGPSNGGLVTTSTAPTTTTTQRTTTTIPTTTTSTIRSISPPILPIDEIDYKIVMYILAILAIIAVIVIAFIKLRKKSEEEKVDERYEEIKRKWESNNYFLRATILL